VKVVRCEGLDRNASLFHVATEFLSATPAYAGSLRHLMRCHGSELAEWLTAASNSGTNVPCGADNQNDDARGPVGASSGHFRITNVLTCLPDETVARRSGNPLADLVTAAQPTAISQ
jgi:hypothetical protein